jgi:hypothetical protein
MRVRVMRFGADLARPDRACVAYWVHSRFSWQAARASVYRREVMIANAKVGLHSGQGRGVPVLLYLSSSMLEARFDPNVGVRRFNEHGSYVKRR